MSFGPAQPVSDGFSSACMRQLNRRLPAQPSFWLAAFVLVAILAASACGWFVYLYTFDGAIQDMRGNAGHRLDLYASSLDREIEKYANFPYVVGVDAAVMRMLRNPEDESLRHQSDVFLEQLNRRIGTLAAYVLDIHGRVIASSNWNRKDSFVGRDLSYRPYFQQASIDRVARFYGIGTTNNEPGYFLATALHTDGRITGYGVVKVSIEQLERSWASAESPAMLSDDHGVVVLSSVQGWKYTALQALGFEARHQIELAQQFNGYRLAPLGMQIRRRFDQNSSIVFLPAVAQPQRNVFITAGLFLAQTRLLPGTPWHLTVFLELKKANDLALTRAALAALATACLFGLSFFFILRHRHMRELLRAREALQCAHDDLECKVADRTADLAAANHQLQEEVDERKRAERTLSDAQSGLMQAGKLAVIGQLSAGIAHELNQPLAALMTLSSNTVKYIERGDIDTARANLSRIGQLVERMGRLTGQLKTFVRKSSGDARSVSLHKSIENSLYLLHQRLVKGDVRLELCGLDEDVWVWCDPNRLEQVLINLIGNALDAMEDQAERRLMIVVTHEATLVRLQIRDNGPGLSEASLLHIFEPFYTTKAPGLGLGLGLPISAGIVRDFGGELSARNMPGGGAEFALTIPENKETAP
jgi:C4-dicarboxylate-specific signal transduction histidine kinase